MKIMRRSFLHYITIWIVCIVALMYLTTFWRSGERLDKDTEETGDEENPQPRDAVNGPLHQKPDASSNDNWKPDGNVVGRRPRDWRRTNLVLTEFDSAFAARLADLTSRKTPGDDPAAVQLARDVIDPPPTNKARIKHVRYIMKTPQAGKVDEITQQMQNGFFVECGALDGERSSNSLYLEKERHWTGLLVEMDPYFYTQLLGKNRNVWSINACLSPYNYITTLPFHGDESGAGRLVLHESAPRKNLVPCFPLQTLLLAINRTRVDYFSLDVEGVELPILKSIPWKEFDIPVLSVEYGHGKDKTPYVDFMKSVGYDVHSDIHYASFEKALFVEDFIFVRKQNSTR